MVDKVGRCPTVKQGFEGFTALPLMSIYEYWENQRSLIG